MTLIAGFRGRGGAVLCSDLLEVQGGYAKKPVDKISLSAKAMREGELRFQFAIGCSGSGSYMDMLQGELVQVLETLAMRQEIDSLDLPHAICSALTDVLVPFYGRHIWPRPSTAPSVDMQFLLLVQPCPFGEPSLIKISETAVHQIESESYACIGIGSYLADYILDILFAGSGVKEYQMAVAAYVLTEVNRNIDGCGIGYSIYHFSESGKMDWSADLYRPEDFSEIKRIIQLSFQTMTDIGPEALSGFSSEKLGELIKEEREKRLRIFEENLALRARFNRNASSERAEA